MEEIRETAKGYYNNLTEEQKSKAIEMFLSMDLNGAGSVNVSEYVKVMGEMEFMSCNNESFFAELDKNGDGMLDFNEFVSLYYLYRSDRLVFCDGHGCRAFLKGIYFTCVDCFYIYQKKKLDTFDLCASCFYSKNYDCRKHTTLLDNFTLLRSMKGSRKKVKPNSDSRLKQASRGTSYAPYYGSPKKSSSSSENKVKPNSDSPLEQPSRGSSYAPYYDSPKKSSSSSENITIVEAAEAFEKAAEVFEKAAEAYEKGAEIGELVADCCGCSIM